MNLLEVKNPKALLARKKIAHRFIGGSRRQTETSPVRDGRKWFSNLLSSLTGLIAFWELKQRLITSSDKPNIIASGVSKKNSLNF
jgi:hypothetical protein